MTHSDKLTIEQIIMRGQMIDRYQERTQGKTIQLDDQFPSLVDLPQPTYIGSFAWTTPTQQLKRLQKKTAFNYGGGWCSPADAARDYLHIKYGEKRRRVTTAQYQEVVAKKRSAPLYAHPCELDDAVYLDLPGAFWQIVRAVGWDVDYHPGRFLSVRSTCEDWPFPEHKLARICLVSASIPGSVKLWTGEKLTFVRSGNKFVNLVLWSLVQDVLNGVAHDVVQAGADYVHTDGFIAHVSKADAVCEAVHRWGLSLSARAWGPATIRGWGNYDIGGRQARIQRRPQTETKMKIADVPRRWLRTRFSKFANEDKAKSELSRAIREDAQFERATHDSTQGREIIIVR